MVPEAEGGAGPPDLEHQDPSSQGVAQSVNVGGATVGRGVENDLAGRDGNLVEGVERQSIDRRQLEKKRLHPRGIAGRDVAGERGGALRLRGKPGSEPRLQGRVRDESQESLLGHPAREESLSKGGEVDVVPEPQPNGRARISPDDHVRLRVARRVCLN